MPETSKKEILDFWNLFKTYHESNKLDKLSDKEININGRTFKVDLKDNRPYIYIEGHVLPLIIKDNNYIFTTGDVVNKQNNMDDFTLEVFPIIKVENGFTATVKVLSEVTKIIKP
jgi:hypothetical protein